MKNIRRRIALLLAAAIMIISIQIPAFADTKNINATGNIDFSIIFGYKISREKLDNFEIDLKLSSNKKTINEKVSPSKSAKGVEVSSAKNEKSSVIQISVKDIPIDKYMISLSSDGYKPYLKEIELKNNNKHIVLYTEGKDFTSGDFTKDGKVDKNDIEILKKKLNTNDSAYDLNGDSNVDIMELSQTYWGANATKPAEINNTSLIMGNVINTQNVENQFKEKNKDIEIKTGNIGDLFSNKETTVAVKFEAKEKITKEKPITIPVEVKTSDKPEEAVKVSQVVIKSPEGEAPKGGYVEYIDVDGKKGEKAFGTAISSKKVASNDVGDILASLAKEKNAKNGKTTIVVDIGNQVPIQKITIQVTDANDGLYASISKIEFLEDVVEDSINQEQSIIKNLKGKAGDASASLSWNGVSNVLGYEILYGTKSGDYTNTVPTTNTSKSISGLKNDTKYYFAVRATSDEYKGPLSNEISLTPFKQQPPEAPTNLDVESLDQSLKVTFTKHSEAKTSTIYYREKGKGNYTPIKADSGYIIRNLINNVSYEIYVTGSNEAGEGRQTQAIIATPRKYQIVKPANPPSYKKIPNTDFTIELLKPTNIDESQYPNGFDINNLIDGDYNTHYTSSTIHKDRGVKVTFKKPTEMDYLSYVTRLDKDENGKFYSTYAKDYKVDIWTDNNTTNTPDIRLKRQIIPIRHNSGDNNGVMILPLKGPTEGGGYINGKINVRKMDIYLYENRWQTNGQGATTISEIMFFEYDSVIDELTALFNDSFTALKSGVTRAQIDSISARIDNILKNSYLMIDEKIAFDELDLAIALQNGGNNNVTKKGAVIEVEQDRKYSSEKDKQIAMSLSDLQPAGVAMEEGYVIVAYAQFDEALGAPELVFSQTKGEHGKYLSPYTLKKGRNIITVPDVNRRGGRGGGSVYIRYNGQPQSNGIKVQLRGEYMKKIPMLDLKDLDEKNAKSNKKKIENYVIQLYKYNAGRPGNYGDITEIALPNVLLSGTANEVKKGLNNINEVSKRTNMIYNTALAWEKNMKLYYDMLGFDKNDKNAIHHPPKTRPNIRVMTIPGGVFMYATSGHIGVPVGSIRGVLGEEPNSKDGLFGWGVNHEIGHAINNISYVIPEITNNIFPLYSQTVNGGRSRIEPSTDGGTDGRYNNIYKKVTSGEMGFVADTWTTLGMFWQLHLGLDKNKDNITEFYYNLHRAYREKPNTENLSKWDRFMKLSAIASKKDLREFFRAWGLEPKEQSVISEMEKYPAPSGKIQYVNDDAYRYMMAGKASVAKNSVPKVTTNVIKQKDTTGKETQDRAIELTMPKLEEGMLGYEIIRKDKTEKVIGFTTQNIFVDDTAANNISYEYKIVAYDKTLQASEVSTPAPARISVDEIFIDKTNLSFSKDKTTGDITIEISDNLNTSEKETVSTVGIKFKNKPSSASTSYSVTITDEKNKEFIAKNSTNPDGSIYFNKPKTNDTDMRIWTYDATKILIKGADNINTIDDIELLAYPGDAVTFTVQNDTPAIGYITHDYPKTTIKQNDVIVVGRYRGHPVNSKIIISGEYVPVDVKNNKPKVYEKAIDGELYMLADLPEDNQVSKIGSGIWIFRPKNQPTADKTHKDDNYEHDIKPHQNVLPQKIKANIFRTDTANAGEKGRLVSDTQWLFVPDELPNITLQSSSKKTDLELSNIQIKP